MSMQDKKTSDSTETKGVDKRDSFHKGSKHGRKWDSKGKKGSYSTDRASAGSNPDSRSDHFDSTKVGMNDPSWYAANEALLRDSGSYSFNNPLGNKVDLSSELQSVDVFSFPGIMALYTAPTVGVSTDNSSPINIAARNIYSYVRFANSGHSNYDSPDLMMYLLAMDNLYSFYAFLVRIYGVVQTYSQYNRYLPRAIIEAMGVDFNDILMNLANFRYYLNTCAVKIGSMCAPNSMSYFTRHMWMYSNIYCDGEGPKSALYFYTPCVTMKYNPTLSTQGGSISSTVFYDIDLPQGRHTFADLQTLMNAAIAAVIEDEDMNIMSGDILKAFGDSGIFKLASVPEDYVVLPVYNPEVLGQIQNATLLGKPSYTSFGITQDATTGALLQCPTFPFSSRALSLEKVFNSYSLQPDPAEVMVNSRLTVMGGTPSPTNSVVKPLSCGSEVVCFGEILQFHDNGSEWIAEPIGRLDAGYIDYDVSTQTTSMLISRLQTAVRLGCFNRHPYVVLFSRSTVDTTTTYAVDGIIGDVENYTVLGSGDLFKLHETALLSEFNVPQMGSFASKSH